MHFQRTLSYCFHRRQHDLLINSTDLQSSARVRSCGGVGSSSFLTAFPFEKGCKLTDVVLQYSIRLRLGLPLPGLSSSSWCICGAPVDVLGTHLFCCNRGGKRQIRHYSVLNTLAAILRQSGIATASECTLSSVGDIVSAAHGLRMDILAYIRSNSPCLIDVSVTHPIPQNPESPSLTRNARHTGSAALARENSKRHICSSSGLPWPGFLPNRCWDFWSLGRPCPCPPSPSRSFLRGWLCRGWPVQYSYTGHHDQMVAQIIMQPSNI